MFLKLNRLPLFVLLIFMSWACNRGPKVIVSSDEDQNNDKNTGIFTEDESFHQHTDTNQVMANDLHIVIVNEVLPTTKYVYLNVTEGNDKYWIATIKQTVNAGERYYFNGGLLKTNFKSTEYNRVFEKIYLVNNLVQENRSNNNVSENDKTSWMKEIKTVTPDNLKKSEHKNSIKIAELLKNSKKLEGKTVQISGECVKINANIMNRNWIHLKDGSSDDFDLVITSSALVDVGSVVTMSGTVVLNKDFGAGYRYDLIMENGTLLP